jgi:hypothetical protein
MRKEKNKTANGESGSGKVKPKSVYTQNRIQSQVVVYISYFELLFIIQNCLSIYFIILF